MKSSQTIPNPCSDQMISMCIFLTGDLVKYKALLTGTTWNCGGGLTPWNTWISCEEHSSKE